jgi:hypothetical protein
MLHTVEVEFDERCYQALLAESTRLGMPIEKVVSKAAVAWVTDIAEATTDCNPSMTVTPS